MIHGCSVSYARLTLMLLSQIIPIPGDHGETWRYGRDALHGCLEVPVNGNDQESSHRLRNVQNKHGGVPVDCVP